MDDIFHPIQYSYQLLHVSWRAAKVQQQQKNCGAFYWVGNRCQMLLCHV